METLKPINFLKKLHKDLNTRYPLIGELELTYRCNLNCVHCYCKGSEHNGELTTKEWKDILDQIHKEGVILLTFTGGEPLLRNDFLNIYSYAKNKGFLISLYTNGLLLEEEIVEYLAKYPPYSIEITLNGMTKEVYESVTQVKESFRKVMVIINNSVKAKLPLVVKANGLKHNRDEILKIKAFSERLLGNKRFKFDFFITPRLNGDKSPCSFRLSPEEIQEIEESDRDMLAQRQEEFCKPNVSRRKPQYLYHCDSWFTQFFIDPYGRLKFCLLSSKYSSDLKEASFKEGFYKFVDILEERWQTDSKCKSCKLRLECAHCPARASLEVGSEEAPVKYFCQLAKMVSARKKLGGGLVKRKRCLISK